MLLGVAISQRSIKETVIAGSNLLVELIALDTNCTYVEWLKNLIFMTLLTRRTIPAISIPYDRRAVIDLFKQNIVKMKLNRCLEFRFKHVQNLIHAYATLNFVKICK